MFLKFEILMFFRVQIKIRINLTAFNLNPEEHQNFEFQKHPYFKPIYKIQFLIKSRDFDDVEKRLISFIIDKIF